MTVIIRFHCNNYVEIMNVLCMLVVTIFVVSQCLPACLRASLEP